MGKSYCCGPDAREQRFKEKLAGILKVHGVEPSARALDTIIPIIRKTEFSPSKVDISENSGIFADWFVGSSKISIYVDGEDKSHDYLCVDATDKSEGIYPICELNKFILSAMVKKL